MNILIPMAGKGKRFQDAGYKVSKPAIPTYNIRTGKKLPMVVCATLDLPGILEDGSNVIYVERDFHKRDGTEDEIKKYFPKALFIMAEQLTEGQACTCLLAESRINNEEELLIAGCDNGMVMDRQLFDGLKKDADVIVFTYRNQEAVLKNPDAYGWMLTDDSGSILDVSIKKAVSDNPQNDHAVVATFWFGKGSIFVEAARKMIRENDRIQGEFYVDEVVRHVIEAGYHAKVFEIQRYLGWGTPEDYEQYQATFEYWRGFLEKEKIV